MTLVIGVTEARKEGGGCSAYECGKERRYSLRPALCSLGETPHAGLENHSTCLEVFGHPGTQ